MNQKGILQPFLTPWRLKWYPRFILAAWAVGFFIAILSGQGVYTLTGRLGGDFPCFYGTARIVAEGHGGNLYNYEVQRESQQGLYPDGEKGCIPFPYPPYVALAYIPFILIPYKFAYIVHTALMVGALFFALRIIRPFSIQLQNHFFICFCLILLFYPFMKAILGGSNTAISFLLLACIWRAEWEDCSFLGGIFLGLLLFKPQYAIPLLGLFAISRKWKVVLWGVATGAVLWILGVWVSGWNWLLEWFDYGRWVIEVAADIDKQNAVSWIGFFEAIWGANSLFTLVFGYLMIGITVIITIFRWLQGHTKGDLSAKIAFAATAIVLIPWHAFYYDAGLLVITWIVLLSYKWDYKAEVIAAVWLWGFSQCLAKWIGFSPIFFFCVFTLIMTLRLTVLLRKTDEPISRDITI